MVRMSQVERVEMANKCERMMRSAIGEVQAFNFVTTVPKGVSPRKWKAAHRTLLKKLKDLLAKAERHHPDETIRYLAKLALKMEGGTYAAHLRVQQKYHPM